MNLGSSTRSGRPPARMAVAALAASGPLLFATAHAATLPEPLGACTGPHCPSTEPAPHNGDFAGQDASVNVFVGGHYQVKDKAAEAEGKVVVLGDLTIDKSGGGVFNMGVAGVGSRVVPPDGTDFVTVGGGVTVKDGNRLIIGGHDSTTTSYGNLRYGTNVTGKTEITPSGKAVQDKNSAKPLRGLLSVIEDTSACAAKAPATGTVRVTSSEAAFTGDGKSARQVFNVTGDLGGDHAIGLTFHKIPAGATVVINLLSPKATVNTYTGSSAPGDPMAELGPNLLWNFPSATDATITGSAQFQGSVMSGNPKGTVTLSPPGMNGRVYLAGTLVQKGSGSEIHRYPFNGDLPECGPRTPAPSTQPSGGPVPSTHQPGSPVPASPAPTAPAVSSTRHAVPGAGPSSSAASESGTPSPAGAAPTPSPAGRPLAATGLHTTAPAAGLAVLLLGTGIAVYARTRRRS
ncbi:choice-of-anchor A family protein [Streptomyces sp. WAC07061]|uniref:choice-of-anchor A family protein n=1 Tax=Streptomyces sp. WAC07061 TaxID=2487410 RepID=UPI000F7B0B6A|nr:choice-of-anchor A family protein [Streptomyces sp. WAC07061]RSS64122.1 choice-of-anchor A family protein [Streptomyces sp. WAC07061]